MLVAVMHANDVSRKGVGAGREAGSTSLDLLRQSVPEVSCESTTHRLLNTSTGESFPLRCRRQRCVHCAPIEAWWKQMIISHGGRSGAPTKFLTLTRAPADWQALRLKFRKYGHCIRRDYGAFDAAWTVELTRSGLPHVHCLVKMPYVPQEALQDRWGSIIDVRAIKGSQVRTAGYVLKEARQVASYGLKGSQDDLSAHLDLNGGRLVHLTRGYLGGLRQEQVRKLILDELNKGEERDSWALIKV